MTQTFELVVFDWDGTLMDSPGRIVASMAAATADVGLTVLPEAAYRDVIGLGLWEALTSLFPTADRAMLEAFVERYRHYFLEACPTEAPLFGGAHELLRAVADSGAFLAVATGKSRAGLDRVLAQTQCASYFHVTRTADETCSKPDPQMLLEIIEELEVSPANVLMVGDTEYDLEMAARAGTPAVAVSFGAHAPQRLAAYEPLACMNSLPQLQQWLATRL